MSGGRGWREQGMHAAAGASGGARAQPPLNRLHLGGPSSTLFTSLSASPSPLLPPAPDRYGMDRRDGKDLAQLLRELEKLEGLRWIRLLCERCGAAPSWLQAAALPAPRC